MSCDIAASENKQGEQPLNIELKWLAIRIFSGTIFLKPICDKQSSVPASRLRRFRTLLAGFLCLKWSAIEYFLVGLHCWWTVWRNFSHHRTFFLFLLTLLLNSWENYQRENKTKPSCSLFCSLSIRRLVCLMLENVHQSPTSSYQTENRNVNSYSMFFLWLIGLKFLQSHSIRRCFVTLQHLSMVKLPGFLSIVRIYHHRWLKSLHWNFILDLWISG